MLCYAAFAALVYASLLTSLCLLKRQQQAETTEERKELVESCDDDGKLSSRPLSRQLRSIEFAFVLVFASVHLLRANSYIGVNDDLLYYYGDDSHDYAKMFGWILPAGRFVCVFVCVCLCVCVFVCLCVCVFVCVFVCVYV